MSSPRPIVASQIVRLASVQSSQRETLSSTRARAVGHRWPEPLLAHGAEPFEQRDVDLFATAEVVVHESAGDAGGARDVLD